MKNNKVRIPSAVVVQYMDNSSTEDITSLKFSGKIDGEKLREGSKIIFVNKNIGPTYYNKIFYVWKHNNHIVLLPIQTWEIITGFEIYVEYGEMFGKKLYMFITDESHDEWQIINNDHFSFDHNSLYLKGN